MSSARVPPRRREWGTLRRPHRDGSTRRSLLLSTRHFGNRFAVTKFVTWRTSEAMAHVLNHESLVASDHVPESDFRPITYCNPAEGSRATDCVSNGVNRATDDKAMLSTTEECQARNVIESRSTAVPLTSYCRPRLHIRPHPIIQLPPRPLRLAVDANSTNVPASDVAPSCGRRSPSGALLL